MKYTDNLPNSLNPEDCNCLQCKELRVYEHIRQYFDNLANCTALTPQELATFFWGIRHIRKDSIADMLINKYLVTCNDGYIRKR